MKRSARSAFYSDGFRFFQPLIGAISPASGRSGDARPDHSAHVTGYGGDQ